MKETQYLNLLFEGLGEENPHSLKPVTAIAWDGTREERFPSGRLDLDKNLFYNGSENTDGDWAGEHRFVQQLTEQHPEAGKHTAFHLAQVWGSRRAAVEGSTHALFDNNRIKAARAVCDEQEANGEYLYIKGAISGIQGYIYANVKSEQSNEGKRVSRRLRGRSFLVAVLGDMIAEQLVEELNLEQANILFVGGGHFNLLIPKSSKKTLDKKVWSINSELLKEFGLKLGIVTAAAAVKAADFQNFGPVFQKANENLEKAKQRRFEGYLSEVFFEKKLGQIKAPLTEEDKKKVRKEEEAMESVGSKIPKASFLLELKGNEYKKIKELKDHGKILTLKSLKTGLLFLQIKQEKESWETVLSILKKIDQEGFTKTKLYRLNSTDFLPPDTIRSDFESLDVAYGFRMLGQYAPADGDILDLSDLAALDEKGGSLKYPKLAAMRLDIDDLGALFGFGLGEKADLKDTLALSREMQLFFGGYFNRIAEKHYLYIVYSGGDDAFVLGSWINILNFSIDLRKAFKKLAIYNPELSFSAGIFMANPKYPITRLAKDTGSEEAKAKKHCSKKDGCNEGEEDKDAIRVFGHNLSWKRFEDMMAFSKELLKQMESKGGKIRRSAIQHLLGVIQSAQKAEDQDFEFYRNLGRLHALLTRRGYSDNQIIKQLLQEMSDFDRFQDYLLPLHYVLYKTR